QRINDAAARSGIRAATQEVLRAVRAKATEKIGQKLFGKFAIKIVSKKVIGIVPVVGAGAAGAINWLFFTRPAGRHAEDYFHMKAGHVCVKSD
ncbi:MAG: hypothetical protein AAFU56_09410, partial [Pseudomonadota bacterium]